MLRFARRNGLELTAELGHEIARVDAALNKLGIATISEMPASLVALSSETIDVAEVVPAAPVSAPPVVVSAPIATMTASDPMVQSAVVATAAEAEPAPPPTVAPPPPLTPMESVIRVHSDLTRLIFPATALSLQTSEPPPGKHRFLGGMPLVVKAAAVMALISALAFVVSAGFIAHKKREYDVDKASTDAKSGKDMAPPPTSPAPQS